MNWLLWREYRRNRLILIVGLVLLLLPYAIALISLWWARRPLSVFDVAPIYSVILFQLTAALLGGNAIAGERADRSAEFMAYLPLSRSRRLVSKLSVTLAIMALLWGVSLLILLSVVHYLNPAVYLNVPHMLGYSAITGLMFFGVAWLVSSLQSSPTFAVCGGLIAPIVIVMGQQAAVWAAWAGDARDEFFYLFVAIGYPVICSIVAVTCFSIGTWYYLRRVEP